VIDDMSGIIFTRQSVNEDDDGEDKVESSLIYQRRLKLYETWVMLILRKHYQERDIAGDNKVTIDFDTVFEKVHPFMPVNYNESAEKKRISGFLDRLISNHRILSSVQGETGHYVISPIIRHVVSIDVLDNLIAEHMHIGVGLGVEGARLPDRVDTLTEQEASEQEQVTIPLQEGED
jgi:hypothetical protein